MFKLPFKVGISSTGPLYSDATTGPPLDKLRTGHSLSDLQKEYRLFTYGPLILYGGLNFNPVQEWINLHSAPRSVYILPLSVPVLRHADKPTRLDNILWAADRSIWPSLGSHLGTMSLINRDKHLYVKPLCQEIPILNVSSADSGLHKSSLLAVTIHTFSVDSNLGRLAFQPSPNLLLETPKLALLPVDPVTLKHANILLNDQPVEQL